MNQQLEFCKTRALSLSTNYAKSASFHRYASNIFKILTILLATFVGTAGFADKQLFSIFIIPICGFIIAVVGSINAAFSPEKKSTIYMQAHVDLMDIIISIENSDINSITHEKIAKFQRKISQIEMNTFSRTGNNGTTTEVKNSPLLQ